MVDKLEKDRCTGCHGCMNECPVKCIEMCYDEEGFLYPVINYDQCITCGKCEQVCPAYQDGQKAGSLKTAYAAFNKDEKIRKNSSSGGVFTALAAELLAHEGIIYGAGFDSEFVVKHIAVREADDLQKLRGAKYVQSAIGDCYLQIKRNLSEGKKVLFSGTPCQVAGLKAFLKKEYDNLYCIDLICHGVPSPRVWKDYLRSVTTKKIREVKFRDKIKSWKNYSFSITLEDNRKIHESAYENIYMKAFLRDIILRPSCYNCACKGVDRESDITLADFWGIEHVLPEMDDDKGTSLVLVHSAKGMQLLEKIGSNIAVKEVDIQKALTFNPSALQSVEMNEKRKSFFEQYNSGETNELMRHLSTVTKATVLERVKKRLYNVIMFSKNRILR